MAHLGVWEKSRIHQQSTLRAPSFPVPGFGTGFLPAFVIEPDDGEPGIPGSAGNFGGGSGTTIVTQRTTNNYIVATQEPDDPADTGIPGSGTNFAQQVIPAHTIPANITAGAANALPASLSAILDAEIGSTRGMLLRRGSSAWQSLALGTIGQAVVSDGTDALWGSVGGGSGGGLVFVGQATVAGSAATTLTISGLDLDTHKRYFIWVSLLSASASNATISMYYNSDTTATNYDVQAIVANAGISGTRNNNAGIFQLSAITSTNGATDFVCWTQKDQLLRPRSTVWGSRDGTTAIVGGGDFHLWRTASTNVTGITLSSSVASAIAIGSSITVFRLTT